MTDVDAAPSNTEATPAGAPVKLADPRIKDATQGYAIFRRLRRDDWESAQKRANIDYQIDGGLPYDEQVMIDANRGEDTNANFMEAKAEDDASQKPFIEMTTVARTLWNISTSHGDENEQVRYGKIISEEFSRTVRAWVDFSYYRLRLAQQFTRHGVGFLYWEDELDWRWRSDGLAAFKLPRNLESRPGAIPYCTCEREMTVDEIYKFIRKEDSVREVGRWDVDAVKQAIGSAVMNDDFIFDDGQWEAVMRRIRENDLAVGSTSPKVKTYHLWAEEFDGAVSHYIGLQTGAVKINGDSDTKKRSGWLYEHRNRFKTGFAGCIIPFFYGIGTHGTIHTIRGQGEMQFGPIAISNRTRCKFVDGVNAASSIVLQAETANDAAQTAYVQMGPFLILSGNSKVQATAMPDVSGRMLPLLNDMATLRENVSGSNARGSAYAGDATQGDRKTKYEIQADQNHTGSIESALLTLFFEPWSRAGDIMFKRMMSDEVSDLTPGGPEALDFIARCLKRGVPEQALRDVYAVEAVRTIGYGSPGARQAAADEIYQMSGSFDAVGQKLAARDRIASIPGVDYQTAESYVGPIDHQRKTVDDQIAEIENGIFQQGIKIPVTDGQNHWVHIQHHETLVTNTIGAFKQGQMQGAQVVPILTAVLANMTEHAQALNIDPLRQKEAAMTRKFLQNANATLEQQENKLVAEQQRAQEQGQQQMGEQPNGDEQRKWESHQQDLQIQREEFAMRQQQFYQTIQQQEVDAQQKRAHRELEAQSSIAAKRAQLNGATP